MKNYRTTLSSITFFALIALFSFTSCQQQTPEIAPVTPTETEVQPNDTTKIGVILETKEFEKAWNAFRFAITAHKEGCQVKVFLMGEAVECVELTHEKYNVMEKYNEFVELGGTVLACGTCLKSRNMEGTETCPLSTMVNCVDMVKWADKTVTF